MTIIIKNRRLSLYSNLIQKQEAGMVLRGWEVKSIRHRRAEIDGAFILMTNGKFLLTGIRIFPLASHHALGLMRQPRKIELLLRKKEMHRLSSLIKQNRLTAIPSSLYIKGAYIKCEIVVVEGRKEFEKKGNSKARLLLNPSHADLHAADLR